ncbi:RNA-binding protein [Stutzerimonas stutzeri]
MADPIRLSKRLADQLGCSRREAELYIEGGWVRVDGEIVEAPYFKVLDQRIELLPGASPVEVLPVTLLWHKPAGVPCPTEPVPGYDLLAKAPRWDADDARQTPRGRHFARQQLLLPLATEASGLLVFSQQREVIRALTQTRTPHEQEYVIEVRGEPKAGGLDRLAKGLAHRGRELKAKASWQSENRLRVVAKAPRADDLRLICEAVGLEMLACKRIRIGRLSMAKLPVGEWRYLGDHERF